MTTKIVRTVHETKRGSWRYGSGRMISESDKRKLAVILLMYSTAQPETGFGLAPVKAQGAHIWYDEVPLFECALGKIAGYGKRRKVALYGPEEE